MIDKERLLGAVTAVTGYTRDDLYGPRRFTRLAHARWALWYVARHGFGMSYPDIGYSFGMRDHTTVMYGVQQAQGWMDSGIDNLVEQVVSVY